MIEQLINAHNESIMQAYASSKLKAQGKKGVAPYLCSQLSALSFEPKLQRLMHPLP
jgi:hypothetical protein